MSTTDHVIAMAGEVRTAFGWLREALTPGNARRNQRTLSPAAQRQRNEQAATDRRERAKLLTGGKMLTGSDKAPADVGVIDARDRVATDVDHVAWVMSSSMRNDLYAADYRPDGRSTDQRFTNAVDWISLNAPRLTNRNTINEAYTGLSAANKYARSVAGGYKPGGRLAAECPACNRRSLEWDCTSTDSREWHVTCVNERCTCTGRDCPCNLPDRQAGMSHLWLEAGWERFAGQLSTKEAS